MSLWFGRRGILKHHQHYPIRAVRSADLSIKARGGNGRRGTAGDCFTVVDHTLRLDESGPRPINVRVVVGAEVAGLWLLGKELRRATRTFSRTGGIVWLRRVTP